MTLNITEYRGALTLTLALLQSERLPNSTRSLISLATPRILMVSSTSFSGHRWRITTI